MRLFLFFLISLVLAGCTVNQNPTAPLTAFQGTETHGGDILVGITKSLSYQLVESSADETAIWSEAKLTPNETIALIAKTPAYSDFLSGGVVTYGWYPQRHIVINRALFTGDGNVSELLDEASLSVVVDMAFAPEKRARASQELRRFGFRSLTYSLGQNDQSPRASVDFVTHFADYAEESLLRAQSCIPVSQSKPSSAELLNFESTLLDRIQSIRKLIRSVPVKAAQFPLFDDHFGIEVDAKAIIISPTNRYILVNPRRFLPSVSRHPSAVALFTLHEYSHFLPLPERDGHYLFSHLSARCL